MPKQGKQKFGDKTRQSGRVGLFDSRAEENEVVVRAYMKSQIQIPDAGLAKVVGLNGQGLSRSRIVAYAIQQWYEDLKRGEQDSLDDVKAWAEAYVKIVYLEPENPEYLTKVYMTVETHAQAEEIAKYLEKYPGVNLTFVKARKGISWRVVFWLALERLAQKIRKAAQES